MSTTVTYKGSTLTTVNNNTKTLKTAGKYMEGDVILTDVSESGGAEINNQDKSVTPSESQQLVTADSGYTGLGTVTVGAISDTYVGSGIARKSSSDVTGPTWQYTSNDTYGYVKHTVNISAGYYSSDATKSFTKVIADITDIPKKAATTIIPTESAQTAVAKFTWTTGDITVAAIPSTYIGSGITQRDSDDLTASGATVSVPAGYYSAAASKSVASGSATAPSTISGSAASVSTGTNTLTLTKTISVTPTVSAGYVSAGTAGNASVSLTASVTTKAAATITPTTTNQTIAAGTYLTGTQTIAGDADLVGSNILSTANIFGVQGTVDFVDIYIRSAAPTSSVGNDGDIYIQE